MILVSYDISNNKKRSKFVRYLKKFGHRIQYSVFQINNSEHILDNIVSEIKNNYSSSFSEEDSIYIFMLSNTCKITRYGYAEHEDENIIVL